VTFRNPSPTTDEIDRALESMKLIAPLPEEEVARQSYILFHVIMQAPISDPAYPQEKKWKASRLAMRGAYKWGEPLPDVGDPHDILTFLGHHFDLATTYSQNQDEPIQNALQALAYASGSVTLEVLKRFNPKEPSFVRGICQMYQNNKPDRLRKAAILFLPRISDGLFDTSGPIMGTEDVKNFCVGWASAVDRIEHTSEIQKAALVVFFRMINSPQWRPYIVVNNWKLLEFLALVPENYQPLRRCIKDPNLTETIRNTASSNTVSLWLAILWLRYVELIPQVRAQLLEATKASAQGRSRIELEKYMSEIDSELRKAEEALMRYTTLSTDPIAIALGNKIDNLDQAKRALAPLKRS